MLSSHRHSEGGRNHAIKKNNQGTITLNEYTLKAAH